MIGPFLIKLVEQPEVLGLYLRDPEGAFDAEGLSASEREILRSGNLRRLREVRADPAAAAALLTRANPSLDAKLQLESIKQTLPATLPAQTGKPFGWQNPSAWASFGTWMLSHALLKRDPNGGLPPFTNEFLPGQGI